MKMKNAPNIKFLPKDKFTEAIIFAGEDAYSHVQHWIESEGKRAWDDVPPVYLGKRQLAELERLNIVDNGRRSVLLWSSFFGHADQMVGLCTGGQLGGRAGQRFVLCG
ncbi:hypothetical protein AI2892V1_4492 [Klebsiella pneumoniae]|nr:hypothetical protein AI2873V1_0443 [Klebsiella pneumoniae]CAF2545198.1 hypothetical protein AI2871V1_0442 [Klebsiella pneumoniae]CAF2658428.1 hypothetical protein AI2891V1_0443 [Klebsiella pneumoniae]CAH5047722.1 hypothetical protein AI2871V1_0442 [Klebsiella pneumoniae]CAH5077348.1 hypothetical protein AI2891V1_0443 [Klebsiella pneumoniae]